MEAALRAGLREPRLLLMQMVGLVLCVAATRANPDETRAFELEVHDDVFHDRAGAHRPLLGMLVVGVHVPVLERLEARAEAHYVVPGRIIRARPPGQG